MAKAIKDVIVNLAETPVKSVDGVYIPLVIQGNAAKEIPFALCKRLEAVEKAGFTQDTEVYKQCNALFAQNGRPARIAVCAVTGKITEALPKMKDKSFRQIIAVPGEGGDTLEELADYVGNTEDKILFLAVDGIEKLPTDKNDRVFAIVYKGKSEGVAGAVVGATAGHPVGSITYKNIILKGIEPEALEIDAVNAIHDAGAICILRKAGDVVTSEGKVMSGEYADVIDGIDYVIATIEYDAQKCLNVNLKIPYLDKGIAQLELVTYNALKKCYTMGIIDDDDDNKPAFSTTFAPRTEVSQEDREDRIYKEGTFTFKVQGAIHYAEINGTFTI